MDHFKSSIIQLVGIDPTLEIERIKKEKQQQKVNANMPALSCFQKCVYAFKRRHDQQTLGLINEINDNSQETTNTMSATIQNELNFVYDVKDVILDLSCVNFIDTQGISGLVQVSVIYLMLS